MTAPSAHSSQPNTRGAGIMFGPDLTLSFLEHNKLVMVVRSHEVSRHLVQKIRLYTHSVRVLNA